MDQDTEITQKPFSTTKEYTRGSLKSSRIEGFEKDNTGKSK